MQKSRNVFSYVRGPCKNSRHSGTGHAGRDGSMQFTGTLKNVSMGTQTYAPSITGGRTMTYAEQLTAFVSWASFQDLSQPAVEQLKIRVLDALGWAIGASRGEPIRLIRAQLEEFGGTPLCTLIGGGKTAPDRAALYNGALVRHLDYNDSYLAPGETCHPSDNLGAVLAAAEYADGDGRDLPTALAVAYQVQCRLSDVAPVRARGFDHTTQGSYAVAAGVSKALGLDTTRTANAIAIRSSTRWPRRSWNPRRSRTRCGASSGGWPAGGLSWAGSNGLTLAPGWWRAMASCFRTITSCWDSGAARTISVLSGRSNTLSRSRRSIRRSSYAIRSCGASSAQRTSAMPCAGARQRRWRAGGSPVLPTRPAGAGVSFRMSPDDRGPSWSRGDR